MNTYEAQSVFFEQHWPALKAALDQGGVPAAGQTIAQYADERQRRVLYLFGCRAVAEREWSGRDRDAVVDFAEAAIAELLRQAAAAPDAETRDKRIDGANIVSYNLAADLACCFDDGGLPRERRHFERGLQAAQDCLAWRRQLKKGAYPFAIAYWASGIHRLALEDAPGALKDFTEALQFAVQDAEQAGQVVTVSAQANFMVLLNHGYLALGRLAAGDVTAHLSLERVLSALQQQAQSENAETREDAEVGLDQLNRAKAWLRL